MYGKSFESMYSGSMYGAGIEVFAVWNWIVTMTHFGVIEINPVALANTLGGTEEQIEKALRYLTRPDPKSRTKAEEGRRLIKEGQFQYRVVNWEKYQQIKDAKKLREYNRVKQAEHRAKLKVPPTVTAEGPEKPWGGPGAKHYTPEEEAEFSKDLTALEKSWPKTGGAA